MTYFRKHKSTASAVYKHISHTGEVLYVGCSGCPACRFTVHRSASSWATSVARIEIEWCPSREQALARERDLIHELRPRFNREWRKRTKRVWPANEGHVYLSKWLDRSGTSISRFASDIGASHDEARSLATSVRHIRFPRAHLICAVTRGYVPTYAWHRYFMAAHGQPPLIADVSEKQASENLRKSLLHHANYPLSGRTGELLTAFAERYSSEGGAA